MLSLLAQMEGMRLVQGSLSYEKDHILWEAACYIALCTFFSGWNKILLLFKGSFQTECLCLDTVGWLFECPLERQSSGGREVQLWLNYDQKKYTGDSDHPLHHESLCQNKSLLHGACG